MRITSVNCCPSQASTALLRCHMCYARLLGPRLTKTIYRHKDKAMCHVATKSLHGEGLSDSVNPSAGGQDRTLNCTEKGSHVCARRNSKGSIIHPDRERLTVELRVKTDPWGLKYTSTCSAPPAPEAQQGDQVAMAHDRLHTSTRNLISPCVYLQRPSYHTPIPRVT